MRVYLTYLLSLLLTGGLLAQSHPLLQSGPMVGHTDMRAVKLWAQTTAPATVYFEYWPADQPKNKKRTEKVKTDKQTAYTAHCVADEVEPGVTYQYQLKINGKKIKLPFRTQFTTQSLWQWRTEPPTIRVAAGSCSYTNETIYDRPGKGYGSDHHIFTAITAQKPDLMLWLGDNVYLREPDWSTPTGIIKRYTHSRSLPELQPLLAATPQYAIWDDHDYGPNDSDGTWAHKETAWDVFNMFWDNPTCGLEGQKGCTTWFQQGDIDFFLLDNRYFRTPNYCKTCPNRTMLGQTQLKWLYESLAASRAPFKIVALGGQVLTSDSTSETYTHFFPAERDSILAFIERENIKNVVFLDGDRHFSELSMVTNAAGNNVYDLTTSSLTAGIYADAKSKSRNKHRVEGTIVVEHNFAILEFSGPFKQRKMKISLYNAAGQELWSKEIESQSYSKK